MKKIKNLAIGKPQNTFGSKSHLTKKLYRFIDTKRTAYPGTVALVLNYDSDQRITLMLFPNGTITQILCFEQPNDFTKDRNLRKTYNLHTHPNPQAKGWSNYINLFPNGTTIHNISLYPGEGGQLAKAPGTRGVILKKQKTHSLVKLKSGATRLIPAHAIAVCGVINNSNHFLKNLRKAGTSRMLGIRPHTRAASKNPVDHPLGGRTRGGAAPQNKNGLKNGSPTAKSRKKHQLEVKSSRKAKLRN